MCVSVILSLSPTATQSCDHSYKRQTGFYGLQAREDELRIQKRFLNQMFAQVKQEFLEKRLRQQQIEQLLGHKSRLPALPSTETAGAADQPSPSTALALRESTAEAPESSPGETCACCGVWHLSRECIMALSVLHLS